MGTPPLQKNKEFPPASPLRLKKKLLRLRRYTTISSNQFQIQSTMTCEACKTIPPVVAEGYEPKGKYEEIAGLKTCMFLPHSFFPCCCLYNLLNHAPIWVSHAVNRCHWRCVYRYQGRCQCVRYLWLFQPGPAGRRFGTYKSLPICAVSRFRINLGLRTNALIRVIDGLCYRSRHPRPGLPRGRVRHARVLWGAFVSAVILLSLP